MARLHLPAFVVIVLAALAASAPAQWQEDGLPLPGLGNMSLPVAVSDGAGGTIFVGRVSDGDHDLVAQRVDGRGNPLWGETGAPVAVVPGSGQYSADIAPDGQGGVYVVWLDSRLPTITTVYAQHLDADGNPSYAAGGTPLVTGSGFTCYFPSVAPLADGGALVGWYLVLGTTVEVRVQRLSPAGAEWSYGGLTVAAATDLDNMVEVAGLSGGRGVVLYNEVDSTYGSRVWAAGLDSEGATVWGPLLVNDGALEERLQDFLADDQDGLYVCTFANVGDTSLYVNYLDSGGQAVSTEGEPVVVSSLPQEGARFAPADDGAFLVWMESVPPANTAFYVQRYQPNLAAQLPAEGRMVLDHSYGRYLYGAAADGAGGLLLAWLDDRWHADRDFFVQRLNSNGYAAWESGGVCLRAHGDYSESIAIVPDGAGGLLAAFAEAPSDFTMYAQRIERNGFWGYPAPSIASVVDVPDDQGGQVLLSWDASRLDDWAEREVTHYTLWRSLPEAALAGRVPRKDWLELVTGGHTAKAAPGPVVRAAPPAAAAPGYWLLLGTVDAYQMPGYAQVVATMADSTAGDPSDQVFQVVAHGASSDEIWYSEVATGRSVDNLAPAMPAHLTGAAGYEPQGMDLSWSPVAAPDLAHYVIHRGTTPGFAPGPSTEVAAVPDTTHFDGGWSLDVAWHYKVAAVDVHGNVGDYAVLGPLAVSAAGDVAPAQTALAGNHPNPFNPTTTIRCEVARGGPVRLRIYDAAGRLVRTLVDGHRERGAFAARWDGRDDAGRAVASGVYLYRLEAAGEVRTRRMVLLK